MIDNLAAPIIVSGMHRSGTSLVAGLLHTSGVHMGTTLMASSSGNPKGHFENLDFTAFHSAILDDNSLSPYGWTTQKEIEISLQRVGEGRRLIEHNRQPREWGFKDPRASLFLDFWSKCLPEAKYVFSFRPPWEVADSLFRRGLSCDEIFNDNPKYALDVWLHYNKNILTFMRSQPGKCLLVSAEDVAANPEGFIRAVESRFELALTFSSEGFSEPQLLSSEISLSEVPERLLAEIPELETVFKALCLQATPLGGSGQSATGSEDRVFDTPSLSLWATLRKRERELRTLRAEMDHVCGVLDTVLKEIKQLKMKAATDEPTAERELENV